MVRGTENACERHWIAGSIQFLQMNVSGGSKEYAADVTNLFRPWRRV